MRMSTHVRFGAILVLLAALLLILPSTGLALVKAGDGYTITDDREYPIIFVHGAAGSELERAGTNLWPGYLGGVLNDTNALQMALNRDGKTDCCGAVSATKVMRYGAGYDLGFVDAQFAPVYQGFYDYMAAEGYGFEEPTDGRVFYDFVYDWRKDNRAATKALEIKVNQVLKDTKAEKVILIGHSMGGIQIRLYMNDAARAKKVGGVIFLATPHHGAPQVYWAYTYGYNFGNVKISDSRMWEAMKNWPAGYQLLPDYPAIQDEATGKFWTMEEQLATTFYSEQEYQHTIDSATGRNATYSPSAGLPNPAFARDAYAFHRDVLGDSVKKYPGVKYYMVAGTGQPTVQYFTARHETRPGFELPILVLEKVKSNNGDGTVPAAGAKIEGVDEFVTVVGEHGAIPGTPAAQAYVTQYRKVINDEVFRESLIDQVRRAAQPQLARLESSALASDGTVLPTKGAAGEAISLIMMFITGAPDEEKIKKRDDLTRSFLAMFKNARVNVEVQASGEKSADNLYVIIDTFKLKEIGLGTINPSTVTVKLQSYEVLGGLADGSIDAYEAYSDGRVQVSGGSLMDKIKLKIFSWVSKYGYRK